MITVLALIAELCKVPGTGIDVFGAPRIALEYQLSCHKRYVSCLMDKDYFNKPKEEKLLACVTRMGRTE
jgi:hypothetical protein